MGNVTPANQPSGSTAPIPASSSVQLTEEQQRTIDSGSWGYAGLLGIYLLGHGAWRQLGIWLSPIGAWLVTMGLWALSHRFLAEGSIASTLVNLVVVLVLLAVVLMFIIYPIRLIFVIKRQLWASGRYPDPQKFMEQERTWDSIGKILLVLNLFWILVRLVIVLFVSK